MINGYQDFYYNVVNLNRAISFYEQALGMKKIFSHEHWCTLGIGNLKLGLHLSALKTIPHTQRDAHGQEAGGTLTLASDNIAEDRQRIEGAGGIILGEADHPWGHTLVFEDLDGNVLKLMLPKY